MNSALWKIFILFIMVIGVQRIVARPNYRAKRVSDSHLADLETKLAFGNNYKGIAITLPIGGGRYDPSKVGRRRRSQRQFMDILLNQSGEDNTNPLDYDNYFNYQFKLH